MNAYLPVTLKIAAIAIVLGTLLGIAVAAIRVYKVPVISTVLRGYVGLMRGIPFVILMFLVYYYLPFLSQTIFGHDINGWNKIIFVEIAFVTNEGAFMGEIFRGAFESVPPVQNEAAYSVGMTKFQAFRRIILPQALKVAIPSYGINLVWLFQETSVTYMIGLSDFIGRASTIGAATGHFLDAYIYMAVVYVVISILIEALFKFIQRKYTFGTSAETA